MVKHWTGSVAFSPAEKENDRLVCASCTWLISEELGDQTRKAGVTDIRLQRPTYMKWIDTKTKLRCAIKSMESIREGLGPDIDWQSIVTPKQAPASRPWYGK